jgi:palmitoyltransferase
VAQSGFITKTFSQSTVTYNAAVGVAVGLCALVVCFTFVLLVLHSYLAALNLSSWEYFSWNKITYLKIWPKKYGSPFS